MYNRGSTNTPKALPSLRRGGLSAMKFMKSVHGLNRITKFTGIYSTRTFRGMRSGSNGLPTQQVWSQLVLVSLLALKTLSGSSCIELV